MSPERKLIAAGYERVANEFARIADPHIYRFLAAPLVGALRAATARCPGPVLDVAAGTGALGRSFPDVVAVDIASSQLARNGAAHRARCAAEDLPFRDDAFAAAGCALGLNHFVDPDRAVREMARVASSVAISTWLRPEATFEPKHLIGAALERQVGRSRSPVGELLDGLGERVGSVEAVRALLAAADLDTDVRELEIEVPWPGLDLYLDYRLSLPTTPQPSDRAAIRDEVARALADLPPDDLTWRPVLVVGIGTRPPPLWSAGPLTCSRAGERSDPG